MIDYEVEMQHLRFPMLHHMRGMVGVTEESFEAIAVVQNGELHPVQIFAELYDIPTDAAGLSHVGMGRPLETCLCFAGE